MAWTAVFDGEAPERVNRWLAHRGVCSRREAEALIAAGRVWIDGEVVGDPGRKILPGQTLAVRDGESGVDPAVSVLIHKPPGLVSAHPAPGQDEARRLIVPDRAALGESPPPPDVSLPPAGRLDRESRGLLILTSDGVVARALIAPETRIAKTYEVRVDGRLTPGAIAQLRHGLSLDGRALKPAGVFRKGEDRLRFILEEGRNRQIRRMCEQVGLRVVDLFRTRIGPLSLDGLPEGRWRYLSPSERQALLTAASSQERL
ncbi:MAG: rRNA pseudouridine synthase [Phenylobacterium sp.]|jgi:23S rRNA pseudouridine2604 synthase|uniref:pseudouridine synthase n=1 Tax=Phenylobacterium sp. TaxID=1871053 RepID=UPI0025F38454|nr:pseudouridine synthase [Phenylobacterium sp.]MCA3740889.1 rRNA pseudouridine synthase [Phenylobacterium sp.]MCA6253456.1 rRNA pseudouridine synthase [Phenylobacterium sp.]MCA6271425.1 rRNA pseudouridine synthase [Phenylobacterium sp.]MCA6277764.1 rRNA pseudouridine synthase [Phenylobacterium sp.]MCA6284722.1 rRNA pseudouridine synthase [Phenylobacterium sp.]